MIENSMEIQPPFKNSTSFRMPDINSEKLGPTVNPVEGGIDWVGMQGISYPLQIDFKGENSIFVNSEVDLMVDLVDPLVRGIHMSRLFELLGQPGQASKDRGLNLDRIRDFLKSMVDCQQGLSQQACLKIKFSLPFVRETLKSKKKTWSQNYFEISAVASPEKIEIFSTAQILYSSTCPNSAALAHELNRQKVELYFTEVKNLSKQFSAEAFLEWFRAQMVATPHAQKSQALVTVSTSQITALDLKSLVLGVEQVLGTPVQSLVKREDEMEFARLNGQNLMFCEDAVRKISAHLKAVYPQHSVQVTHFESLHAHNAVSSISTFEKDVRRDRP